MEAVGSPECSYPPKYSVISQEIVILIFTIMRASDLISCCKGYFILGYNAQKITCIVMHCIFLFHEAQASTALYHLMVLWKSSGLQKKLKWGV
jgi:hypothetical protein